jgi:hypothetical protein
MLKYDVMLSGEDIVPLFRAGSGRQERSEIAGAAFRVGKGAIVFSPAPKAWSNPELVEYFDALAKLPDLLGRPLDPLPELTGVFQRTAVWLTALPALAIAAVALSPFWAPPVARAALRVGATFDPAFLGPDALRGVRSDPAEASYWYRRARDLGEPEAERRLKSLETKWGRELR